MTVLSDHTPPPVAQMTPYQLYLYYQSLNNGEESSGRNDNSRSEEELDSSTIPETSACIHVWDLQTGKIAYRLLPILPNVNQHYSITDIQLSPDYSKVFASIQIRGQTHSEEHLYCWDFSSTNWESSEVVQDFKALELDSRDPIQQKIGKSWVCFM
ncbi:hypothetical protein G6F68_012896 [Rhizopus microsporus]|nr:hypothetical protein G6F68_012896 [Rhizopus microsporus]